MLCRAAERKEIPIWHNQERVTRERVAPDNSWPRKKRD